MIGQGGRKKSAMTRVQLSRSANGNFVVYDWGRMHGQGIDASQGAVAILNWNIHAREGNFQNTNFAFPHKRRSLDSQVFRSRKEINEPAPVHKLRMSKDIPKIK